MSMSLSWTSRTPNPGLVVALVVCALPALTSSQVPSSEMGDGRIDIPTIVDVLRSHEESVRRRQLEFITLRKEYSIGSGQEANRTPVYDDRYLRKATEWDQKRRIEIYAVLENDEAEVKMFRTVTLDGVQFRQLLGGHKKGPGSITAASKSGGVRDFTLIRTGVTGSLASDLAKADPGDVRIGTATDEAGKKMISVEWKSGNWRRRMLLDPGKQLIPVLIDNSMEYSEAVQKAQGWLRGCSSRAAREWSLRDGMMMPARIDIRSWMEFTDGREQVVKAEESVELVQCRRLREEPSAEVFRLKFPHGTAVSLTDVEASYTVGGDPREQAEAIERALKERRIAAAQNNALEGASTKPSQHPADDSSAEHGNDRGGAETDVAWYTRGWVLVGVLAAVGVTIIAIGFLRIRRRSGRIRRTAG